MLNTIYIYILIILQIPLISFICHIINIKKYQYIFVTCYFEDREHINRKLHNPNTYRKWINTFFKNINSSNIVVFTDNRTLLYKYNPLKIYYYKSIEFVPININKKELYQYQMVLDTNGSERNWRTKMIWNSKIYFMKKATNDFNSQIYIWIDIGCMRYEQNYNNLPDTNKIEILAKNNQMNFFVIRNTSFIPYNIYTNKCLYIIATSFFGTKQAILKFSEKYNHILNHYLNNKIYFGTEQNIYDITVLKYFTNSIIYPLYQSNCNERSVFWKVIKFYTSDTCSSNIKPFIYYTNININYTNKKNNCKM